MNSGSGQNPPGHSDHNTYTCSEPLSEPFARRPARCHFVQCSWGMLRNPVGFGTKPHQGSTQKLAAD
eukprot:s1398_g8.t1